jgi:hypothetical protein
MVFDGVRDTSASLTTGDKYGAEGRAAEPGVSTDFWREGRKFLAAPQNLFD